MTINERMAAFKQLSSLSERTTDEVLQWLNTHGFFAAPASTKYHGNYEGGLFDHSYEVTQQLIRLTDNNHLYWDRRESPFIVGMFHDLCKIDNYEAINLQLELSEFPYRYAAQPTLRGHGDKSIMLLSSLMRLTMEEVLCIRYHMGAFTDKEEWKDYTNAIHSYSNVLWTHQADMLATHVSMI